jgi:hypothetical protein
VGQERIGRYELRHTDAGLEVRSRPTLCSWLRGSDPRRMLSAADVQLAMRASVTHGRPHGSPKPTRSVRRWHVAFFDARGERVGPRFHFALETVAREFASRIAPGAEPR